MFCERAECVGQRGRSDEQIVDIFGRFRHCGNLDRCERLWVVDEFHDIIKPIVWDA